MDPLHALTAGAPVTWALLLAIAGIGVLSLTAAPGLVDRHLLRPHGLARRGAWHTLVTHGFIHADFAHLLFNGFTLWAFGVGLERHLGSPRFAGLYVAGLLVAAAATVLRHRRDPGYASLGASGAILAVLFASIVVFPAASIYILPIPVPIPAPLFALAYLAFSLYASRARLGRVNHDAHIAGALTGVAFVALAEPQALAAAWRALRSWIG